MLLALTLTMVAGQQAAAGGPTKLKACDLLSASDVAEVLGVSVEAGAERPAMQPKPGLSICGFDSGAKLGDIVLVVEEPGRKTFKVSRRRAKESPTLPPYSGIADLGDRAFEAGSQVSVLIDGIYISVFAQYWAEDFQPNARELASAVVAAIESS